MCILFNFSSQDKSFQIGGYVQAKILSEGGKFVPFVACVRDMDDNSLYLSFMRVTSVNGEDLYYWPDIPDDSRENKDAVIKVLNEPTVKQIRRKLMFSFSDL